jgi:hypothetical protein
MVGQATLTIGTEQAEVLYQLEELRNGRMAGTLTLLAGADQRDTPGPERSLSIQLEDGRQFRFRVTSLIGRELRVAGTIGPA